MLGLSGSGWIKYLMIMEDIVVFAKEKGEAKRIEQEKEYQALRRQIEEEQNEKKKNKTRVIIIIALVIATILGYLAVLNGRYAETATAIVFDQWTGEYVTYDKHKR